MHFKYICSDCNKEFVTDKVMYQCPVCSKKNKKGKFQKGNLIVRLDDKDLKEVAKKDKVSIYDFFPYKIITPEVFPVGPTPLMQPKRLAEKYGIKNTFCKLDSTLPSGSFKDRASQLIASQALFHKQHKIALASTGNAGAAMSCAGAAYGLEIILFVPETAPVNKLMQSVLYGATVVPVKGTYDDAFALSIEYTKAFGGINRNTAYNPMTIEGKKSVSIELFEQTDRKLFDVIYVPTGDGCIIAGVCKGLFDLKQAHLIDHLPKVVCCQSSKSNAIAKAFESGEMNDLPNANTKADSINVSSPANGRMAVRYIKETGGWATVVEDEEIFNSQLELAKESGIFVEPAAACAWAAFTKDSEKLKNEFGPDVRVCVLLTGTGFKDMKAFEGRVKIPEAIENSKQAVIDRFS